MVNDRTEKKSSAVAEHSRASGDGQDSSADLVGSEKVMSRRGRSLGVDRLSGVYLFALFVVIFSIWAPSLFLTQGTLHSVASNQSITMFLALAALLPLVVGAFDLSIGATANLAAVIVVLAQNDLGLGVWASIAIAILSCFIIGFLNGFFVIKFHINSFIVTLAMTSIIAAVQTILTNGGQPLPPASSLWNSLTQATVFGFQVIVLYMIVITFFLWWLLEHTPTGRYMYATGGNIDAARLSGINTEKWTWVSLVASAVIAGIGGILYSSLSGPSLTFGSGLLLPAFAAAFLGSTQIFPGRFNVWGTFIAVYVLATGIKGLQLVTSVQWIGDMFNGVALLLAVGVAVWRRRRIEKSV